MENKKIAKKKQNKTNAKREARNKNITIILRASIVIIYNAIMIWSVLSLRKIEFAAPFGMYFQLPIMIASGVLSAAAVAWLVFSLVKHISYPRLCVTPVMLSGMLVYLFGITAVYDFAVKFMLWDYIAIAALVFASLAYILYQAYLRIFYK